MLPTSVFSISAKQAISDAVKALMWTPGADSLTPATMARMEL